jgi:dephospho-CoA kinase
MIVLGLTGSVGMGKSAVAQILRTLGIPVHDADAAVHALLGPGGEAVADVTRLFPTTRAGDRIDRAALGRIVFGDPAKMKALENILHPLVRARSDAFVADMRAEGHALCVLDIPLLFETGGESRVDRIAVVTAPPDAQRARVLARPGMTEERFTAILNSQLPDTEKQKRAHHVIANDGDLDDLKANVERLVAELTAPYR